MAQYHSVSPSTLLSPAPVVLVSCAEPDHPNHPNLITVAWTGTVNSDPPMVSVSIRPSRYSHHMITESGEFVVNLVDAALCRAADFCGVRSGRDLDKARETGLSFRDAAGMSVAPALDGSPMSLSCKVRRQLGLGSHDLFLAEVVAISVRQDLMDDRGAIRLEKAGLVAYSHGLYQSLGPVLGFFGYAVARPEVFSRRMSALEQPEWELKSARFQAAEALKSVLKPGDRAVDATMGNGHDTELLCSLVGSMGHVYAFDLQEAAVNSTRARLEKDGYLDRVSLFRLSHDRMAENVPGPVKAIVFNLGWLPGGDHSVTTRTETTLSAVRQALELLLPRGVLVLCVYPGHAEGQREKAALEKMLSALPPQQYNVLTQSFPNAGPGAPVCHVIQRQGLASSALPKQRKSHG